MKILKKIFGFKFTVYVWMIAIAIFVFIGAYFLGVSNSNYKGNQTTESYSMVKYIEKVNQVVFLNVGIQKIDTISNVQKVFGWEIPYSEKKAIIILNYSAKLGIKQAVSIQENGENSFTVHIPEFEVIGVELDSDNPYELYSQNGELLSASTKNVDTGEAVAKGLSSDEQKEYLKQYKEMIKESAENYYNTLFKSAYPDCTLEFVYD
jgi:hypothetical protein